MNLREVVESVPQKKRSKSIEVVRVWIEILEEKSGGKKPRPEIKKLILEAYESGYHEISDGCTVVSEMGVFIKHPTCVMHDFLYFTNRFGKIGADWKFFQANSDFGHPIRGFVRFIGVLTLGWLAFFGHRKREKAYWKTLSTEEKITEKIKKK